MNRPDDLPPAEPGYADAVAELDRILAELEGDEPDVDLLAARVARAAELVRLCRSRIRAARLDVERIVAELEDPPQDDEP